MEHIKFSTLVIIFAGLLSFTSCQVYRQNVMFDEEGFEMADSLFEASSPSHTNYVIQKHDFIYIDVYANGGERLVDPLNEYQKQTGQENTLKERPKYLIQEGGMVTLPMVGNISLVDYTLNQADSLLAIAYSEYYENPFVITQLANRRCVVLGPQGGKVVPLENEQMNLVEVIALYGGLDERSKASRIKVIRGDLAAPSVQLVDLSTLDGMTKASMNIEANDIVYIEPGRKVFSESLRDITPLATIISSLMTVSILFISLR